MKMKNLVLAGLGALVAGGIATAADAPDPCANFAWNVTHELAVFGGSATAAAAGRDAASAPALAPDQLYELTLASQADVHFAHTPSKKGLDDASYAGLARLHITTPGVYRVAMDSPLWVDLVDGDKLVTSGDFTGNHSCHKLAKLVEFQLAAGDVILQLSRANDPHVHVALIPAPRNKS